MSDARSSSATATTGTADPARPYRGRFAPSPSGPLHFGSLIAAVGSYLEARTRGGEWLVRIEDLDPPRERPGAADAILATLEQLDLHWDGPILRQSTRVDAYQAALDRLAAAGRTFRCACSRAQLTALPQNLRRDPGDELFHPRGCPTGAGRCRDEYGLPFPDAGPGCRVHGPSPRPAMRERGGDRR